MPPLSQGQGLQKSCDREMQERACERVQAQPILRGQGRVTCLTQWNTDIVC